MTIQGLSLRSMQAALLAITITAIGAGQATAQSAANLKFAGIKVKNFGQMDDRFFRGAQPKEDDFKALSALGINTIIDLTNEPTDYGKRAAEAAGMRYVNIPMSSKTRPQDEQIIQFLKLVDDSSTGRFFVHCEGGRHRTGVMGAVYRIKNGWDFDKAYKEMKDFDYYSRWGHGSLKDYVEDYSKSLRSIEASTGTASSNR